MRFTINKFRSAFTLIELMTSMFISSVLILVVGVLVVSAANSWRDTYQLAHKQIQEDATAVTLSFGSIGRIANRTNYVIYNIAGGVFTPVVSPTPNVETVVSGNAVEFRYWNVSLDSEDTYNLMDVTKTATAYALYYLAGGNLKVDYGAYPPGGVPAGGGARNTANVKTMMLARNVSTSPGIGAFSHTMLNGLGKGSVRINIILTDPNAAKQTKVETAVLMRNKWP